MYMINNYAKLKMNNIFLVIFSGFCWYFKILQNSNFYVERLNGSGIFKGVGDLYHWVIRWIIDVDFKSLGFLGVH